MAIEPTVMLHFSDGEVIRTTFPIAHSEKYFERALQRDPGMIVTIETTIPVATVLGMAQKRRGKTQICFEELHHDQSGT